jgi:hypothetical protein
MDNPTFQNLPTTEVARLVRESGSKVVAVFPINGTRRWFALEGDPNDDYLTTMLEKHRAMYQMFFEHGLSTLLTPAFGPDLLERSQAYIDLAVLGLAQLTQHPAFLKFYDEYQVRVRFYGDYRKYLTAPAVAHLPNLFDEITERTRHYDRNRLWFGLFANEATETVAELSVQFWQNHHRLPTKAEIVELYYGEPVAPASMFIGFDKFSAFDMPLLTTGHEDLYFTVAPSLYLNETGLRSILYDHFFARRQPEVDDYATTHLSEMSEFYRANTQNVLGVGVVRNQIWYPF